MRIRDRQLAFVSAPARASTLVCALVGSVLVACGGAPGPATSTPTSGGAAAPASLPEPLATALPDGRADDSLTLTSTTGDSVSIVWVHGRHAGALTWAGGEVAASGNDVGLFALRSTSAGAESWIWDTPTLLAQAGAITGGRPVARSGWDPAITRAADGSDVEAANVEQHRRAYTLFSAHDAAMFELFAPDIIETNVSEAADAVGRPALEEMNRSFWAGFSDIGVDVEAAWGAGEFTVLRGRLHGTQDGELAALGLSRSGRTLDVPFVEVVRWEAGLAAHAYPFMDGFVLASQLGLLGE